MRALLRWLAVDEKAWARPEESFGALYAFLNGIRRAQREQALAAERAARRMPTAVARPNTEGQLVDGVARRFSSRPEGAGSAGEGVRRGAAADKGAEDRSTELLKLLLRRASITRQEVEGSDGDGWSDESGDD